MAVAQEYSLRVVFSCLPDGGLYFGANPPKRAKYCSFYLALSLLACKREMFI